MMLLIVVSVAAPVIFARDRNAARGVKRLLLFMLAFYAAYVAYITLIHTTNHVPKPWEW